MPTQDRETDVDEALRHVQVAVPQTAADAAILRARTRDLDRALGALMHTDTDEEE